MALDTYHCFVVHNNKMVFVNVEAGDRTWINA